MGMQRRVYNATTSPRGPAVACLWFVAVLIAALVAVFAFGEFRSG